VHPAEGLASAACVLLGLVPARRAQTAFPQAAGPSRSTAFRIAQPRRDEPRLLGGGCLLLKRRAAGRVVQNSTRGGMGRRDWTRSGDWAGVIVRGRAQTCLPRDRAPGRLRPAGRKGRTQPPAPVRRRWPAEGREAVHRHATIASSDIQTHCSSASPQPSGSIVSSLQTSPVETDPIRRQFTATATLHAPR